MKNNKTLCEIRQEKLNILVLEIQKLDGLDGLTAMLGEALSQNIVLMDYFRDEEECLNEE